MASLYVLCLAMASLLVLTSMEVVNGHSVKGVGASENAGMSRLHINTVDPDCEVEGEEMEVEKDGQWEYWQKYISDLTRRIENTQPGLSLNTETQQGLAIGAATGSATSFSSSTSTDNNMRHGTGVVFIAGSGPFGNTFERKFITVGAGGGTGATGGAVAAGSGADGGAGVVAKAGAIATAGAGASAGTERGAVYGAGASAGAGAAAAAVGVDGVDAGHGLRADSTGIVNSFVSTGNTMTGGDSRVFVHTWPAIKTGNQGSAVNLPSIINTGDGSTVGAESIASAASSTMGVFESTAFPSGSHKTSDVVSTDNQKAYSLSEAVSMYMRVLSRIQQGKENNVMSFPSGSTISPSDALVKDMMQDFLTAQKASATSASSSSAASNSNSVGAVGNGGTNPALSNRVSSQFSAVGDSSSMSVSNVDMLDLGSGDVSRGIPSGHAPISQGIASDHVLGVSGTSVPGVDNTINTGKPNTETFDRSLLVDAGATATGSVSSDISHTSDVSSNTGSTVFTSSSNADALSTWSTMSDHLKMIVAEFKHLSPENGTPNNDGSGTWPSPVSNSKSSDMFTGSHGHMVTTAKKSNANGTPNENSVATDDNVVNTAINMNTQPSNGHTAPVRDNSVTGTAESFAQSRVFASQDMLHNFLLGGSGNGGHTGSTFDAGLDQLMADFMKQSHTSGTQADHISGNSLAKTPGTSLDKNFVNSVDQTSGTSMDTSGSTFGVVDSLTGTPKSHTFGGVDSLTGTPKSHTFGGVDNLTGTPKSHAFGSLDQAAGSITDHGSNTLFYPKPDTVLSLTDSHSGTHVDPTFGATLNHVSGTPKDNTFGTQLVPVSGTTKGSTGTKQDQIPKDNQESVVMLGDSNNAAFLERMFGGEAPNPFSTPASKDTVPNTDPYPKHGR